MNINCYKIVYKCTCERRQVMKDVGNGSMLSIGCGVVKLIIGFAIVQCRSVN